MTGRRQNIKGVRAWRHWLVALLFVPLSMVQAAVTLKETAPKTYTVKKDDTLWDIANLFLDKPWLWPQLWRTNTQIVNPHLIYPGDVLRIRMVNGQPVLEVAREKKRLTLSPSTVKQTKPSPINTLPWSAIAPYVNQNEIIAEDKYEILPHLLGNSSGGIRFITDDLVLSRSYGRPQDQYRVVRKQSTITDMNGAVLGIQIHHIANANMVESKIPTQWLVKVNESNLEARRGDRLFAGELPEPQDMILQPATTQRAHVIGNLHQHQLLGKNDVVVIDLGHADIQPGTVMGIYAQGPAIIDGENPRYASEANAVSSPFKDGSTIIQPALKVGELIIFKTFEKASYGIITRAREMVKNGDIVANP
ncbi:LysM peptidoglycan-binding domain-containing protein [Salinimonas chungwhensis]|uniref:LysM peptidoglycan-binding domain-containing protein n=1 Tax=Salinimonas chungwhensis TaxID=265425 RepID=UPI00035DD432|nr:LysM peptidoglycan-binding domain-containing protein [Salinimonas chungwhensis]